MLRLSWHGSGWGGKAAGGAMSDHQNSEDPKARVAGVIAPPPLLLLAAVVAGLLLDRIVGWHPLDFLEGGWRWGLGAVLVAAGFGLVAWASTRFSRAGTNVPTNRPVEALVTDGPYRFSRNPIYVGGTLVLLGIAVLTRSFGMVLGLVVFLAVMNGLVIKREERLLDRLFGEPYRAYRAKVRRWL